MLWIKFYMHTQPESYSSQFGKNSGLTEWIGWLLVMLVVFGVLGLSMFLKSEEFIKFAMYIIIGGLGTGMIIKGFLDAKFLANETNLASQQVALLEKVDSIEEFLKLSNPSGFRNHIQSLHTISLNSQNVSQDNLIEILFSRLLAKNKVVELFASILITLGLIGTILGLIFMMGNLEVIMDSLGDNTEGMMGMLFGDDGPLGGLGVAFYTTLMGAVLGGVVLRVLTSVIDANVTRYVAHVAELTEVYVLPYLQKASQTRSEQGNQ